MARRLYLMSDNSFRPLLTNKAVIARIVVYILKKLKITSAIFSHQ